MPVSVHRATLRDLNALVPLFDAYRQFYGRPSDLGGANEFLAKRLSLHESLILLAHESLDAPIGFAQLYPLFSSLSMERTYVLNDLFVMPAMRRRGAGRALLREAVGNARLRGAVGLSLSTAHDNTAAQALYESLGWRRETAFCQYTLSLQHD